jgi:hypothetical protein
MTSTLATPMASKALPGSRFDHLFFSAASVLILVSVFIGFAPTYFLAGVFRAHLPNTLIHFHAAVFSCWILLLVLQTSLVSAHRVDIHRRVGWFGFALACLMVILGLPQMSDKNSHPTMSDYAFSIRPSPPVANFPLRTACAHVAECADLNFGAATCSQIISFIGAPS